MQLFLANLTEDIEREGANVSQMVELSMRRNMES